MFDHKVCRPNARSRSLSVETLETRRLLASDFTDELVVGGLDSPIALISLPNGNMLVGEKDGSVKIVDPTESVPKARNYLTIPNVETERERGLWDFALDPNFASNNYIYAVFASAETDRIRISRFVHDSDHAHASDETIIWEDPDQYLPLGRRCCHYGGGLDFGPDDHLYLTIGDKWRTPSDSQDLSLSAGKIIRLDTSQIDASGGWEVGGNNSHIIPKDNPFVDGPGGNLDEIWAYGLRNPFRAEWDIPSGRFFIGDVGGNVQETAKEEINVGVAGANYAWPEFEGIVNRSRFEDPIFAYDHTEPTPDGGAVAGGFVYRGNQFPNEYQGAYFFGDYVSGWIRYLKFDQNGNVIDAKPNTQKVDAFDFIETPIAPVAIVQGADGALYYNDYIGQLHRVSFNNSNLPPVITTATATPVQGSAPLEVSFSGGANDPESASLSYTWDFGDGNTRNRRNPTHEYAATGQYLATLRVSDGVNTTVSDPITITVGDAPVIESISPADGTLFRGGEVLTLSAVVTDDAPVDDYSWTIRFVHNAHTHPEFDDLPGKTIQFEIPVTGHDFSDQTGYEIELTVTDRDGIPATEIIRIYPEKVDVTFNTDFPGTLPYDLDGLPRTGNFVHDTLINFQHTITVPEVVYDGGRQYQFTQWSDGTRSAANTFIVPNANLTLTAEYADVGASDLITNGLVLHLDAETGVTTSGSTVTGWSDLSGNNNGLTGLGNPQLVSGGLNGRDTIAFDGNGDALQRTGTLRGFPTGASDRSAFVVAKYNENGRGGVTYGDAATNRAFGLIVSKDGNLEVQAWGGANDQTSNEQGAGAGWLVQSAIVDGNTLSHYKDGAQIDVQSHTYNTAAGGSLVIGAEIDGAPYVDMEIAEVLIYDRALSNSERLAVGSYLQDKYFGSNQRPRANDDASTTSQGTAVTLSVLANDDLGDTPTSIVSVTQGGNGSVSTDGATVTYDPDTGFTGTDTFTYTIRDDDGDRSTGTVTVTVDNSSSSAGGLYVSSSSSGNVDGFGFADEDILAYDSATDTWTKHFDGSDVGLGSKDVNAFQVSTDGSIYLSLDAATNVDGVGNVDDSDIVLFTPTSTGGNTRGSFSLFFDGSDYGLSTDGEDIDAIAFTPDGRLVISTTAAHTVDAAGGGSLKGADEDLIVLDTGAGGFARFFDGSDVAMSNRSEDVGGATIDPATGDIYLTTTGNYSVAGLSGDNDDVFSFSGTTGNNTSGSFAAFFDGDAQGLGGENIDGVAVLSSASGGGGGDARPNAVGDTASTVEGDSVNINVMSNDSLGDTPTTITGVTQGSDGTVTTDGSRVTYDPDNGFTGTDSFTYTITDDDGDRSTATVTVTVSSGGGGAAELVTNGLVLQLDAQSGVSTNGSTVVGWNDQSGRGNNLSSLGNPQLVSGGLGGFDVIEFDGTTDRLERTANLAGFPTGAEDRTAFVVTRYDSNGFGGVAYGVPSSNQTFGLVVDSGGNLAVQGWGKNNDFKSNVAGTGGGWLVQSVVVNNNTVTHYKDGASIDVASRTYNTAAGGTLVIGAEIDGTPALNMSVAEVLIYNRALTNSERASVDAYLADKYFSSGGGGSGGSDSGSGGSDSGSGGSDSGSGSGSGSGPAADGIFVSSTTGGAVDGVNFADEDILAYDASSGTWGMHFDGSDVGLGSNDVNAFHITADGSIYLSLNAAGSIPGVGDVDDSDIVLFTPTSTGNNTQGTFALYFDGSDYGLSTDGEDVDAIGFAADGSLVISTVAGFTIDAAGGGSLRGKDEDLSVFDASAGGFATYFDGSDVGLGDSGEDVIGTTIDASTGDVYLTTLGNYSVSGLSGDSDDVFVFSGSTGVNTNGDFRSFLDGGSIGLAGEDLDGLSISASSGDALLVVARPSSPLDTNGDNQVTAADALLVVNRMARISVEAEQVDSGTDPADVNGDGRVSAVDALMVINFLGQQQASQESLFDVEPEEDDEFDHVLEAVDLALTVGLN